MQLYGRDRGPGPGRNGGRRPRRRTPDLLRLYPQRLDPGRGRAQLRGRQEIRGLPGNLAVSKPWDFDAFSPPDDAASFALLNTKRFQFGAAASIQEPRQNDDELGGMRSIGWSFQAGGFMNVWPTHYMRIHVEGLKGLSSQSGIVVNSGIDFVAHPEKWNLSIGPRYSWGDDHYNGTYFGVTPGEALASPFIANPFHARAGSHNAGVQFMAEYKLFPRWRVTFDGAYSRILGDDAKSPLVAQLGTPDQFSVGTGLRFMLQN
ncbi:MAG: MipA/OmpV family protein [Caulobacteraceae bacterium]